MKQELDVFGKKPVRKVEYKGEMYYSVLDIIEHFTQTIAPQTEWARLKRRNIVLVKMCKQLRMKALDGEIYTTDALNRDGVFRLVMSMPSPNTEFFKTLLSRAGTRAIAETEDPELGFRRLPTIKKTAIYRHAPSLLHAPDFDGSLRAEWYQRGVETDAFGILSTTIMRWTFGITLSKHKALKGLNQEDLCDHLTNLELIFNALGEEMTRLIAVRDNARGFLENVRAAQKGGSLVGDVRRNFEKKIGLESRVTEELFGSKWGKFGGRIARKYVNLHKKNARNA